LEERKEIINVDCLYLISRFNNPTGETFNSKYISTIRDFLNKKRGLIIEDDVYHIFNYSLTESYRSLKQQFPQQVLYLDSFSKILAPGFRLGYIAASKDKIQLLINLQKYVLSSPSTLSQKLVYEILKENYQSIKKEINAHYRKKMEILLNGLNKNGLSKYYHLPRGGFYVWLRTQKKFDENIKKQLLDSDVNVVDGRIYYTNKPKENYIRLSIANIANDKIDRAVKIIKKILYE
jgi:2-aminoadipate transaminase